MAYIPGAAGLQIREKRERRGMSRKELAGRLGCSAEAVRLWEAGRHRPSAPHSLKLCGILGIPLDLFGEQESEAGPCTELQALRLLQTRCELTIHFKKKKIYLKENLRRQFRHAVEISIHPDNERELLIREKKEGRPKREYYSAMVVRRITDAVGAEGNTRFLCVREQDGWRGMFLPGMTESYLWDNLRKKGGVPEVEISCRDSILQALYRRCRNLAEWEEVDAFYQIGYQMAVCTNPFGGQKLWHDILIYTSALLDGVRSIGRRCRKAESSLSLNQTAGAYTKRTYGELWGQEAAFSQSIEIREFKEGLIWIEERVLCWRMQECDRGNIRPKKNLIPFLSRVIRSLQEKADKYFGKSYIRSRLVMETME